MGKKGQVTIFIILAIVIVAGIAAYFLLKDNFTQNMSPDLKRGYDAYLICVEERLERGISILGQQGGYIYIDELPFYPGSSYMPSSSQLDFYGNPVPYWFYVSGNNIVREQRPALTQMQSELNRYVSEGLNDCDFADLNEEGLIVNIYAGSADVLIREDKVELQLDNPVYLFFENDSAVVKNHKISVDSKLGKFYKLSSELMDLEKKDTFLESYGLDVMRLDAPVSGVEFGCAPKVFNEFEIKEDISAGLETTIGSLKLKGDYYSLRDPKNSYFVLELENNVEENVNFIYSREWPTKIEMYGEKVVQPVGSQQGLGILGFCILPYNFVYDINFPVLVQFYDGRELFQFGMVAIIKNNQPRSAGSVFEGANVQPEICANANTNITVNAYDLNLNPVQANIRFSCLGDSCELGNLNKLGSGELLVPQCLNGKLSAYAEGYAPASVYISTNKELSADILMKKIYEIKTDLGNVAQATVVFSSPDYSAVVNYPDDKSVSLVEGEYNITAYVYKNATLSFPGVKDRKCLTVSSNNLGALFGQTEEKCFDIDIPPQNIEQALVGGGQGYDYFTEEQLKNSKELNLNIQLFGTPGSMEDLESNYIEWEDAIVEARFE